MKRVKDEPTVSPVQHICRVPGFACFEKGLPGHVQDWVLAVQKREQKRLDDLGRGRLGMRVSNSKLTGKKNRVHSSMTSYGP
jgi:hypothetical protein